jgi:hypothetical protein
VLSRVLRPRTAHGVILIGSIRRECLDYIIIFDERHLRGVLSSYFDYYHKMRTHLSLHNVIGGMNFT